MIRRYHSLDHIPYIPDVLPAFAVELVEVLQELLVVHLDWVADVDQLVRCIRHALFVHEELLVELLAWAETHVLDLDVDIRGQSGESDEVPSHVVDFHRLSHVEDEDLAALRVVRRLEHQGDGLRDGHEVADDPLVGDGHWTAFCDLLLEERDDGAVGAEDVTEADRDEVGLRVLPVHHLDDYLTDTLRGTHDVRRVHSLIRGDQDEALHAGVGRGTGGLEGTHDVVLDRFVRAHLHERYVLVRRRMEDHVRLILLHHAADTVRVPAGADQGHEVQLRVLHEELLLDAVRVVLVDVEDDELLRLVARDLAAELRADRSATAGDEDGLPLDHAEDFFVVDLDRFPTEEVEDVDVAELADADFAVHELVDARDSLQLTATLLTDIEDLRALFGGCGRDRVDDFRDLVLLYGTEDVVSGTDDRDTVEDAALLVQVVVDQADRIPLQVLTGEELLDEHTAGIARADDHHALAWFAALPLAGDTVEETDEAVEEAHAGVQHEAEAVPDDVVGPWHVHMHEEHAERIQYEKYQVGADHVEELDETCEVPDAVIQTEKVEHRDGADDKVRHREEVAPEIVVRDCREREVEAEEQAEEVGENEDTGVGDHQHAGVHHPGLLEMSGFSLRKRRIRGAVVFSCSVDLFTHTLSLYPTCSAGCTAWFSLRPVDESLYRIGISSCTERRKTLLFVSVFITVPEDAGAGDHHDRGADHGAGTVDGVRSCICTRVHETEIDQDNRGHKDHADETFPL